MEQKEPRAGALDEGLAVDGDFIVGPDIDSRVRERNTVQGDAAVADPAFGLAAGAKPRPRHDLGDAGVPRTLGLGGLGTVQCQVPVCGLRAGEGRPLAHPGILGWRAYGFAAFWGDDPAAPVRQPETLPLHGVENALCLDVRA